ncbi:hypothetical protein [Rhodovulum sulfidophilum]|uniref:Uncharacterized protein n=1 Tax=Rhodovulum sulfidophilum TaxID=35806 RepID=A0ABS1RR30_RHOSU|nr:hypothetical protein [Rhodovulum sulfidophilum]MBL3608515.1 hypothetical protein [Rhodovulum sulfidophilum]MCE8456254.1 hypothetical protein [Rhodovulum sulfidophilum]
MSINGSTRQANAVRDPFRSMSKAKKPTKKPKEAPAIQLGEHSRYQIKSGWLAGTFVARAFPKPPTKARGMIAEATGATEEAAISALHEIIDAREDRRTDERRKDTQNGVNVPSVEEYVEAIRQIALSGPQCAMLTALSLAEEDGLKDAQMANAAGYKSKASANRSLVAAGLLIAEYLSVESQADDAPGAPEGAALLGFRGATANEEETGNWVLHPELRQAVRQVL